jgi:hypothetical protein
LVVTALHFFVGKHTASGKPVEETLGSHCHGAERAA